MRTAVALAALVGVLVAGCGSGHESEPPASESATDAAATACRLYLRGEGVRVGFRGIGADQACDEWVSLHAERSEFYSRQPDGKTTGRVGCAFEKKDLKAAIVDTGELFSGSKVKDICAEFLADGWDEWTEPLVEQQRMQEEAERRAADEARAREEQEARLNREWDDLQCGGADVQLSPAVERRCDELAGVSP
jgi:hypothetical protein